jgi:hypothetical protein
LHYQPVGGVQNKNLKRGGLRHQTFLGFFSFKRPTARFGEEKQKLSERRFTQVVTWHIRGERVNIVPKNCR